MKGRLCFAIGLIACLSTPLPAYACEQLQAKVERYTQLKRVGGSAKQMNRWQEQRKHYAERYRECLRSQPRMHRASGDQKKNKHTTPDYQKRRSATSDNPVTIKLLATCNFWIDTYNRTPSPEHQSYRDTACRALDDAQREAPPLTTQHIPQRSLQECIKPDNLLDDEVRECMAGERQPDWQ